MKVLTLFCSGTWYDGNQPQELICELSQQMNGKQGEDWILFPGPGSGQILALYTTVHKDSSDVFTRAMSTVSPLAFSPDSQVDPFVMATMKLGYDFLGGLALGKGMQKNVEILMTELAQMKQKPDVINMIGWSRGACTCHMMANRLYKEKGYSDIVVNIFSIDPVPGPKNFKEEILSIPANVKSFTLILMENERRYLFRAADIVIKDRKKTRELRLVFPGTHSTPVEVQSDLAGKAVREVVRHLAQWSLTGWGTNLKPTWHLSDEQICELFSIMSLSPAASPSSKEVRKVGSTTTWTPLSRSFAQAPSPWINAFHLMTFEKAHPALFQLIQKVGSTRMEIPLELLEKLKKLLKGAPYTFKFIMKHFFTPASSPKVTSSPGPLAEKDGQFMRSKL